MILELKKDLGTLYVDCGDVVCLPMDAIIKIMDQLKIEHNFDEKIGEYIKKIGGICCGFRCDGKYRVSKATDQLGSSLIIIDEYGWG